MKKMKNSFSTAVLILMSVLCQNAFGQPEWAVNPADYQYTMTITGIGTFNCEETTNANDQIAAFVGDECRGVATFSTDVDGTLLAYLTVYDNLAQGTEMNFKLFEAATNAIIDSPQTLTFSDGAILGNPDQPYEFLTEYGISSIHLPGDSLMGSYEPGTSVSELFLINSVGDTISGNFSFIDDELGPDNDQFSLLTSFLILENALVPAVQDTLIIHIQGTAQGGCSINDVIALPVINTNNPPSGLVTDTVQVPENRAIGTLVTLLEAEDESEQDSHEFALFEGDPNNTDNASFSITGAELLTDRSLDYEAQVWYTLTVLITDEAGNSVTDTLWIEVLDEIEFEDLKAGNLLTPDGDGHNDTFFVPNIKIFNNYDLFIYNGWGAEVYSTSEYDNSWTGVANNDKELPSGTYYYIFRDRDDEDKRFKGDIHIYRSNKF